ncbi:MAG: hypothetical protein COV07_03775 [Candidatus Vogelbacteria bacterium CG10_big_fil_rev_8_21_14_0_10_45_14]|uniref:ZIP zinc transporter n=1 Tax=Candidatus Vogelbacteria bacterium CG10_big_fil_rev_8_21_14_0_10_45_14 TaxID=1975042 RepID=A0A2H0RJ51_9BACT|nr:MAG: hypothetical protein COV07_03775 [Candidatus Vogelbacteria bacterium CG10_big_fil_rev_8_21_14_0_10_45_14]
MLTVIGYALIGGLFSLVGGLILVWHSKSILPRITPLIGFAAGAFLSVSFFELLPEAIELKGEVHDVVPYFMLGFTIFFILERGIMRYFGSHKSDNANHHEHTESLPALIIIGDSTHNFIDGFIIAIAYLANPAIGLVTTLAVAAHEIPQEIGDFAILLDRGWHKWRIIWVNILSSLLTVLGAIIGYYAGVGFEEYLPYLLAGVAGIFTYIATVDLLPEVNDRAGHEFKPSVIISFVLGLAIVAYLISLSHTA